MSGSSLVAIATGKAVREELYRCVETIERTTEQAYLATILHNTTERRTELRAIRTYTSPVR
jgi:hypothetical protein